jgi:diguanylate cyclase (GGDEF)-like protein
MSQKPKGLCQPLSAKFGELERRLHHLEQDRVAIHSKLSTLEQQTYFDALTGLRNQSMFGSQVSTLLREKKPFALLYIDIDGLKQLNTERGHQFADQLIRAAAEAIRCALRRRTDQDNVFRRGTAADEFLVILEKADLHTGRKLAEQILTQLRSLSDPLTASIGVAAWDGRDNLTCDAMERAAELGMQKAKLEGRNCVRVNAREEP